MILTSHKNNNIFSRIPYHLLTQAVNQLPFLEKFSPHFLGKFYSSISFDIVFFLISLYSSLQISNSFSVCLSYSSEILAFRTNWRPFCAPQKHDSKYEQCLK